MNPTDIIALGALLISLVSVAVTAYMTHRAYLLEKHIDEEGHRLEEIARVEASKASLLQALQGEKESVGFTALHIARMGLPAEDAYRQQLIMALVQAAVFSSSDRARAIVYAVLRDHMSKHRTEILSVVGTVDSMFRSLTNLQAEELDLSRGIRRLEVLRKAIAA